MEKSKKEERSTLEGKADGKPGKLKRMAEWLEIQHEEWKRQRKQEVTELWSVENGAEVRRGRQASRQAGSTLSLNCSCGLHRMFWRWRLASTISSDTLARATRLARQKLESRILLELGIKIRTRGLNLMEFVPRLMLLMSFEGSIQVNTYFGEKCGNIAL